MIASPTINTKALNMFRFIEPPPIVKCLLSQPFLALCPLGIHLLEILEAVNRFISASEKL